LNKPKLWTKNFISVCIANFLVFTMFYYLLVTLPIYALQDLKVSPSAVGLITTVFLISAIIVRPFSGNWMVTFGKRTIFLASLLILFVSSTLYFIPRSITGLLILRLFNGIGFGMATTAIGAIVADLIPKSRQGEGMGYYGLTTNLAMVVGPFLGLVVIQNQGSNEVFIVHTIGCMVALLSGLLVKLPKITLATKKAKSSTGFKDMFVIPAIPISLVAAFFAIIYSAIIAFVSVYAKEIGLESASSYFFAVYASVLLVSRPFTGRWFDKYGANKIIYPSILCFAVGVYVLSISTTPLLFLTSAGLIGLGWGTAAPSLQTIAIQVASPKQRPLATATYLSIFDTGFGLGSFVFGLAAASIEYSSLYFYGSFFIIAGIGVYYLLHGKLASINYNEPDTIKTLEYEA
jgi:MFS family permease